jgi:hypothetical protein
MVGHLHCTSPLFELELPRDICCIDYVTRVT